MVRREFYVGLDLGKRQDHTALAVVERATDERLRMDWVAWMRKPEREERLGLRWVGRLRLGTTYPAVVRWVRETTERLAAEGDCTLVVDATGVGGPVVDLLREARLRCGLTPVMITGGAGWRRGNGVWNVARGELLSGLRVMLETGELRVAAGMKDGELLKRELMALRERRGKVESGSEHDDLAMAAALACWWARRRDWVRPEPGAYLPVI